MTRFSPGLIFPRSVGVITSSAFLGSQEIAANNATQNFTGMNFGTADANRYLIACFAAGTINRTWTSCTIGGVAATKIADNHNAGVSATRVCSIWMANVPTGATGTVSVVQSGTNSTALALFGCISVTGLTLQDKAEQDGTSNAMALATTAGGIVLGIDAAGGTAAALGGDIDTVDVNGILVTTGFRYTAGHDAAVAGGTGNITVGNLGSIGSCCVVSLKPT